MGDPVRDDLPRGRLRSLNCVLLSLGRIAPRSGLAVIPLRTRECPLTDDPESLTVTLKLYWRI